MASLNMVAILSMNKGEGLRSKSLRISSVTWASIESEGTLRTRNESASAANRVMWRFCFCLPSTSAMHLNVILEPQRQRHRGKVHT